jgi:hypothetical protein
MGCTACTVSSALIFSTYGYACFHVSNSCRCCVKFRVVFLSFPVRFFDWFANTPRVQHVDRVGRAEKSVHRSEPNTMRSVTGMAPKPKPLGILFLKLCVSRPSPLSLKFGHHLRPLPGFMVGMRELRRSAEL